METSSTLTVQQEQQEKSLLLFVVVVGYIITFVVAANGGTRYSIQQLLVGIGCGVIYLIFGFFEKEIFQRFLPNTRIAIFFPIQLALALSIGWTLGPGGNWLISLPLAAMAAERLSSRSRWFVYVGLLIAIILPIAHYSTWHDALINTLVISTAIFFIDLVTRFRLNERQARAKAENLALQLEGANRRLAEYASQAEELAVTQERNRLAHEIHDNLGHYLTIANVQIEAARATLHSDPGRAQAALEKAHGLVKKGLMSVRESVSALRTSPVENRSLEDVFIALIGETQASGIDVEFHILGEPRALDEKVALALYRVLQEGLTNVRKHANAAHVDVDLDFSQSNTVRLAIRDDGRGAEEIGGGFGLIGIQERIHLLEGEYHIDTELGKGFCLEVTVPVAEEAGG